MHFGVYQYHLNLKKKKVIGVVIYFSYNFIEEDMLIPGTAMNSIYLLAKVTTSAQKEDLYDFSLGEVYFAPQP